MSADTQRKLALEEEIRQLEAKLLRMKELSSFKGFYNRFFCHLKESKTNEEAFEKTNNEYQELFGVSRYSDYQSYKQMVRYHLKKQS